MLAIVILAVGIGATAGMYTLVRAVLIRDLPFVGPARLVWIYNLRTERDRAPLSLPDLDDYRREASTLAALAPFTNWTTNLTGDGPPERLEGVRVSGHFFAVLGTTAMLGRVLQPADEERETRATVLTHGLWLRRFGGDAGVIGRNVRLNGTNYTVVGVLPPRFLFPFREAELAVPLTLRADPRRTDRGANFLRVIARLAPGVPLEQAKAQLDGIARRLQQTYPDDDARKIGISLYPLAGEIVRDYRRMLWTLFGSVGLVLLVGCVNLANLLLVRAAGRRGELAVRLSLDATRGRLLRQLLGEAALLAVIGGTCGLVLADFGIAAWRKWGPADFPQLADLAVDGHVVLFAIAVSGVTAMVCGAAPAWLASRDRALIFPGASRSSTPNRVQQRALRLFVALPLAAAMVLLIGMRLMGRGLTRLQHVEPGFTPSTPCRFNSRYHQRHMGTAMLSCVSSRC